MKFLIESKRLNVYLNSDILSITIKIYKCDIGFTIEKQMSGLSSLFG